MKKILKKNIFPIFGAFRDLFVRILPIELRKKEYGFAFLVHPRNTYDVTRHFPFTKYFPERFTLFLLRHFWPVRVSEVTGLASQKTGKPVRGWVIAAPITAEQMMKDRSLARKMIIRSAVLAKKTGAKMIGLGALTASLSRGGKDITENVDVYVTTGHAYTAYTVTQNLFALAKIFDIPKEDLSVAIVGAAGSIGHASAELAAREGFADLLLVDVERKKESVLELAEKLKEINPRAKFEISYDIRAVKRADFIVTATNAPEVIITNDVVKPGAVIIDDAQPSDVAPEVLKRSDVLAIEAGVVDTPGINSHFNFGLKNKHDNYCCMSEVLILASNENAGHYTIGRFTLESVDEISEMGKKLGFRLGSFQNFLESISHEKLERVKNIARKNHGTDT